MSGTVQILTAITAMIGAVASIIAVIRISYVHKATNSIVTQLLIEGRAAGHAAGLEQGRNERKG